MRKYRLMFTETIIHVPILKSFPFSIWEGSATSDFNYVVPQLVRWILGFVFVSGFSWVHLSITSHLLLKIFILDTFLTEAKNDRWKGDNYKWLGYWCVLQLSIWKDKISLEGVGILSYFISVRCLLICTCSIVGYLGTTSSYNFYRSC